jgi:CBS domain-containing protein
MMQMVSEVMTRDVRSVTPHESLQRAAQLMDELNVGALPVCDGERLVGMVTDRDITVRATAAGRSPSEAHVDEVMSTDVRWCFEDEPVDSVMQKMADTQIRRVPVVSHDERHRLVGIVALGDLITSPGDGAQKQRVEDTAARISTPSEPDRSDPAQQARHHRRPSGGTPSEGSNTGTATGFAGTDALLAEGRDRAEPGALIDPSGPWNSTPSSAAGTAGSIDNTGETGAPGGTDAAGAVGASGGTAGTAGSAGTGVGAKP